VVNYRDTEQTDSNGDESVDSERDIVPGTSSAHWPTTLALLLYCKCSGRV